MKLCILYNPATDFVSAQQYMDDTERVRRNSRLRELKEPERWIVKP